MWEKFQKPAPTQPTSIATSSSVATSSSIQKPTAVEKVTPVPAPLTRPRTTIDQREKNLRAYKAIKKGAEKKLRAQWDQERKDAKAKKLAKKNARKAKKLGEVL